MYKYRKKPIVIEAWKFTYPYNVPMPSWLNDAIRDGIVYQHYGNDPCMTIKTLEGDLRSDIGDFIIRGVKGELYPCKPDIFNMTYDYLKESAFDYNI